MKTILFVNHKEKHCGVYQYGYRVANILKLSTRYNFVYCEVDKAEDFIAVMRTYEPRGVVFNYYPITMPWLNRSITSQYHNTILYGIHHEGQEPDHLYFHYYLMCDSTYEDTRYKFHLPRPLFNTMDPTIINSSIPIISTFGFGSKYKGFKQIVRLVNEQFDEAIIKMHITSAFYCENSEQLTKDIMEECNQQEIKKGIDLKLSNNFISDEKLLLFLRSSSLNIFLYDDLIGQGLSSVIDYAVSVKVPIAIRKSHMFKHIVDTSPSICIEDRPLADIISSGTDLLDQYREKWSNANLIKACEDVLEKTLI